MSQSIAALRLLTLCAVLSLGLQSAAQSTQETISVQISKTKNRLSYKVNSATVPYAKLLELLGGLIKNRGQAQRVVILVPTSITLAELGNIEGIVGKVGFSTVESYVLDSTGEYATKMPPNQLVNWIPVAKLTGR